MHFSAYFTSPKRGFFCMFTGIITNLGKLTNKDGSVFTFNTSLTFCKKINIGTSVAVNGVCLTALKKSTKNSFSVEIMPETLSKTMLRYLKFNDLVNLELPTTPTTMLSGHIVQGHIDGIAKLTNITKQGNSYILKFVLPANLTKYVTEKGSIALNGISLTVIEAKKKYFTAGIIPYTWDNTMLKTIKIGDSTNIETDILAKYVEKFLKK